jgi:hypothetical protein
MNTTFAARFKLEVLDRVGEITVIALDAGLLEAAIKQLSRRADERPAGKILFVAGLLSYEYDFRGFRTFSSKLESATSRCTNAGPSSSSDTADFSSRNTLR